MVDIDALLEKAGYIKCQIDMTKLIFAREKEVFTLVNKLKAELENSEGLERRDRLNEISLLLGEQDALKTLWVMLSSLKHQAGIPHQS